MDRINTSPRALWIPALLGAATLAAFWPVLLNDFVLYDDPLYVTDNLHVLAGLSSTNIAWAFYGSAASNWHPLTWLSHMLDVQLFGLRPGGHHLTSLLLHIANAILLYRLLLTLTSAPGRSAAVAALFALHPLHVESVAWVAERKDVLSTFFFLLTLHAYARYVRESGQAQPSCLHRAAPGGQERTEVGVPGPKSRAGPLTRAPWSSYLLALFLFALGLMSKPMLVTLPFVLLLFDYWPLGRLQFVRRPLVNAPGTAAGASGNPAREPTNSAPPLLRLICEKIPFFCLAFASCVATFLVQDHSHARTAVLPLASRLANAVASYWKYLGKFVWPAHLSVFYPHPDTRYPISHQWPVWAIAAAALLLAAVSFYAVWRLKRKPWLAIGWLWYLGTLVPVIGIIQVGSQAMADRYTYIPLIGVFIGLVWTLAELLGRPPASKAVLATAAALALLACLALTHNQVKYWRDDFTLFTHALAVDHENPMAQFHVGTGLRMQGKPAEAIPHFQAVIKAAPALAEGYYGLALCLNVQEKPQETIDLFQKALLAAPWDARVHNHFGAALWVLGRRADAQAQYLEALRLTPDFPEALVNLGVALSARGDLAGAAARFADALRLKPDYGEALTRLAEIMLKQDHLAEAEACYRQWMHLYPADPEARINLGGVLWRRGNPLEALDQYAQAARLAPQLPVAHFDLATALSAQGRFDQAVAEFGAALRWKPDYLEAWTSLGRALAAQGRFDQAKTPFQEAVRLCPTNADLRLFLGSALMMAGQTNQAAPAFAEALRLEPGLVDQTVRAGKALATQGQLDAALARFQTALWLRPDDPNAHENLGLLLQQQGKPDEAEAHLQAARRLRQPPPQSR